MSKQISSPIPEHELKTVPLSQVVRSGKQPRERFDPAAHDELVASVRKHGLLQPLIVREDGKGGYKLVAGERRWRACNELGVRKVPVVVLQGKINSAQIAMVENLHRRDLSGVEEGHWYQDMIDSYGYTPETIAHFTGKSVTHVKQMLALTQLPLGLQEAQLNEMLNVDAAILLQRRCRTPREMEEVYDRVASQCGTKRVPTKVVERFLDRRDAEAAAGGRGRGRPPKVAPVAASGLMDGAQVFVDALEAVFGPITTREGGTELAQDKLLALWGRLDHSERQRLVHLLSTAHRALPQLITFLRRRGVAEELAHRRSSPRAA